MFGIPSMIRAITGTIVTIFTETDKAVTTLAKSNEVWHKSTDYNLKRSIKVAVKEKAVELETLQEKANSKLESIKTGLSKQIDDELEIYFNNKDKD